MLLPFLQKRYYLKGHYGFFEPLWNGMKIFAANLLFLACLNYLDEFFIAKSDSYPCDCNVGSRWGQTEIKLCDLHEDGEESRFVGRELQGVTRSVWLLDRIRC